MSARVIFSKITKDCGTLNDDNLSVMLIILLISGVCLLEQAAANAVPVNEERKLEVCLRDANSQLMKLEVPAEVKELEEMAVANGLGEIYLLDLVGSSKDNINKVKQVFKEVAKKSRYDKSCLAFDNSAMSVIRTFDCEPKMREFSSVNAINNLNLLGPDNAVNKINRYRMACIMMKLSV